MNPIKKPLGIYVHIPFCEKKCDYCDFLSAPSDHKTKEAYVNALVNEIKSYKDIIKEYLVKTIYIGGGTPSSIDEKYITKIIKEIKENFQVDLEEVTIELNPGTISKNKLQAYKKAGINRLSIGLQSSKNKELELLGRSHSYEQFLENYYLARSLGFTNINVDLISGLPGQSLQDWEDTLEKILKLSPEHISAYSLIIEENTPFYKRYSNKDLDEEVDRLIYSRTKEVLEENKYSRYEISNYCKEGYESIHNIFYWTGTEYLGIGLGSSSFIQDKRFHNERDLGIYIKNSHNPYLIRKNEEKLSQKDQMEEFIFLGLRLVSGIKKSDFKQKFGMDIEKLYKKVLDQSYKEGVLEEKDGYIYLTDYGMDVSNIVMARFLLD